MVVRSRPKSLAVHINLIPHIGSDKKREAQTTNETGNVEKRIESPLEDITPGDAKVGVDHK